MFLPLSPDCQSVSDQLVRILKTVLDTYTRNLSLPSSTYGTGKRIALSVKTKDNLFTPRCVVLYVNIQFHRIFVYIHHKYMEVV